jgi:hypothetical protein
MKPWYQSKTIWFNIISGIIGVLAIPQFISVLPSFVLNYVVVVNAIGNWILRTYFTSTSIGSS